MNTQYSNHQWMTATPAIDTLSLFELTLPGTHNAGTDWKASYPFFGPPRHWLACQHDTFYSQLRNGSRVLDIRLTYDQNAEGLGKFPMHHGGHRNSRTLGHLVTDINDFLAKNPDEFIIVDFHDLAGSNFDFKYFNEIIIRFLGERLIPRGNRSLSLEQLKRISPMQRVLVAARSHQALHSGVFIDSINHQWSGKDITTAKELQQFIGNVLENSFSVWAPWSLSATSYSIAGGPVDIHSDLDVWFDPAKSDWAQQCNIINVDFIEESRIVEFCRAANLNKVRQRNA
ncbi:phosphatidylinositol-specific phospholipase C domain-containing protein [Pseudomonas sp. M20]|jgi:1-phosphatidylinositol phosphodiesterase|uniref:phosphatidylinositol-specific phospholipase C domain-containing protein n=1 Tax=unclassified Pseudomonas TaxID=196821 RepID=UPI00131FB584|nr:phosphatidylinositol-specific phospholipase C domain-containing protein [Pseudomonas sp. R84]QHC96114.1 phospholipase [Pseudomonas sp. R84]